MFFISLYDLKLVRSCRSSPLACHVLEPLRVCVLLSLNLSSHGRPAGGMIDRIQVTCSSQQDRQEWLDHLQRQTKLISIVTPSARPSPVPCHTVSQPV